MGTAILENNLTEEYSFYPDKTSIVIHMLFEFLAFIIILRISYDFLLFAPVFGFVLMVIFFIFMILSLSSYSRLSLKELFTEGPDIIISSNGIWLRETGLIEWVNINNLDVGVGGRSHYMMRINHNSIITEKSLKYIRCNNLKSNIVKELQDTIGKFWSNEKNLGTHSV